MPQNSIPETTGGKYLLTDTDGDVGYIYFYIYAENETTRIVICGAHSASRVSLSGDIR